MSNAARALRPCPARWFELLVARDDTTLALVALAATGAVELQARASAPQPEAFADLRPLLQQFAAMAQRYRSVWPRDALQASACPEPPVRALTRCLSCLRAWAKEAEPLVHALQRHARERAELQRWQAALALLEGTRIDLQQAANPGPVVQVRLAVLPPGAGLDLAAPPELVTQPLGPLPSVEAGEGDAGATTGPCLLALGTPAALQAMTQQVLALHGQVLTPPPWLAADPQASAAQARARQAALAQGEAEARQALEAAAATHGLRQALADAQRLQWVLDNVHGLEATGLFCWITGWTSAAPAALEQAIEASGARALLRMAAPPPDAQAPMLLANPPWARPFEVFARALGMPAGNEADPSALLALAVPLMFGYMFGDVGQGLVIAGGGLALRRRFPIARPFVAGGLSAAAFGLLFGSVFSLHGLRPLWLAPLDAPLAVLTAPLVGGALLLTLGLLLAGLQAHWRGALAAWLGSDLGFLVCYFGVLAALGLGLLGRPAGPGLVVAAAGTLWFVVGRGRRLADDRQAGQAGPAKRVPIVETVLGLAAAAGECVERLLQILINTLSFARVGAFALAHAGLSAAIAALMTACDSLPARVAVLVLGNALVIALEGLVVSIQTTRLVLFEFFARFLQGQGRVFRPLPLPPASSGPDHPRTHPSDQATSSNPTMQESPL